MIKIKSKKIILSVLFLLICSLIPFNISADNNNMAKYVRAKSLFRKGYYHFNNMNYLASVEFFRKALVAYPEYHTSREYLARAYNLAGYTTEALTEWQILYNSSKNHSVKAKIDSLRLRSVAKNYKTKIDEFILADTINSSNMGRFHFSYPVDLTIDDEKNIYITSFDTGKIIKIASNKEGVTTKTPDFNSKAYGIDYNNNKLVFSDFAHDKIYVTDVYFNTLYETGKKGQEDGSFHGPEGVVFDNNGYIYVADSGNNRIQKFTPKARFVLSFGKKGKYEAELNNPTDVAIINNKVYVTDTGNKRIAVFDKSGNFIKNIKIAGLQTPRGIVAHNKILAISDEKSGMFLYNTENKSINHFNSWSNDSGFSRLVSVEFDRDDYLYSLDHNKEKIYIFSPIQKRYSNINLEITSVDVRKFPVVAFYVNVRQKDGRPVYGLKQDNFKIIEDKAKISGVYINYIKDKTRSLSLALCVDRSKSSKKYHKDMPWTSEFILKKMRKNDRLEVLNFNKDVWVGNKFDWSRRRSLKAIKKSEYNNGKNIGKVLYTAITDLIKKENRRAVILLTDGAVNSDSFAVYSERNIINYAKSHFIPVYAIYYKEKNSSLQNICKETGGALIKASQINLLQSIYSKVKKSEEHRYVIVYSSFKDNRTNKYTDWWSEVTIEVDLKSQKGIEWGGYFIPKF